MRHSYSKMYLPLLATLTLATLLPSKAEARRGLVLITTGDTIKHIADVATDLQPVIREVTGSSVDYKVGYLHQRIGVFWIDLWTWGGEYVLYDESEQDLWELNAEETAALMRTTPDKLSAPLFYSFPPGLLALGVIGAVCVGLNTFAGKTDPQEDEHVDTLLSDSRYEEALVAIVDHYNLKQMAANEEAESGVASQQTFEDDAVVFDHAVQKLVEQGIDYNDAFCNLNLLRDAAITAQP
jgi:hypothetical protein